MLTRQTQTLASATEESAGFDSGRPDTPRVTLRVVRSESGSNIEIRDLLHA
jgi:hypothetical protein